MLKEEKRKMWEEKLAREREDRMRTVRKDIDGRDVVIKEYRGCKDIDIQFSDGAVIEHITYAAFLRAVLKSPLKTFNDDKIINENNKILERYRKLRIGEERINNRGERARIIEYRGARDIDIEFESGEVVRRIQYKRFEEGLIHKNYISKREKKRLKYEKIPENCIKVGDRRKSKDGREMEVIKYSGARNIDVRFSDGEVVRRITKNQFITGDISLREKEIKRLTK